MIDSHAHLGAIIADELPHMLNRACLAGVSAIINIATNGETLLRGKEMLAVKEPSIFLAAATTPHDVEKEGDIFFPQVVQAATEKSLVAIGETGLDYYYHHSPKETQIFFLRKYLDLAAWAKLPVIIHCREAFSDLFSILDQSSHQLPVLIHCFTGTKEEAREVVARGWYLSLSGIVTFPKSTELQEVAKIVPFDRLLIETDTPYLAPQPYRGKKNEPAYVVEVAATVARLRNISIEDVKQQTCENTKRFFQLSSL